MVVMGPEMVGSCGRADNARIEYWLRLCRRPWSLLKAGRKAEDAVAPARTVVNIVNGGDTIGVRIGGRGRGIHLR